MKNQEQSRFVYLVEYDLKVSLVCQKPKGLTFSPQRSMWFLRSFEFSVGKDTGLENSTLPWNGPIGVYNIHDADQVKVMIAQMQHHMEKCAFQRVQNSIRSAGFVLDEVIPASGTVPKKAGFSKLWHAIRKAFIFDGM